MLQIFASNPEFQAPYAIESTRKEAREDALKQILKMVKEIGFSWENFKDLNKT